MLTINDQAISRDDYKITHKYSGLDELSFFVSTRDPAYAEIAEESIILDGRTPYSVYSISVVGGLAEVKATLDLHELSSHLYLDFDSGSVTLTELGNAIVPDGWSFEDMSFSNIRRTTRSAAATALDVLDAVRKKYNVTYRFNPADRKVFAYSQIPPAPVGAYVTEELNLQELQYHGKSDGLVTRLYARGKDGLTFASINGGMEYIDDFSFTDKIICGYWEDDRYEVAENLLEDARKRLHDLAQPVRSYSCTVMNLAKTNPAIYKFLDLSLLQTVTLVDLTHKTNVDHQVVEYTEFPNYPERDEIILSTIAPTIQKQVQDIKKELADPESDFQKILDTAIKNATGDILEGSGGYVTFDVDELGRVAQILIMDTPYKSTATKVWRWNLGGLGYSRNGVNGPYTTAMTQDGSLVADFITSGSMSAARITAGILRSQSGDFTLDLDNSIIRISGDAGFTIATSNFKIQSIVGAEAVDALSMQAVPNDNGGTDVVLRIEDAVQLSDNFILPVENGGTGQSTLTGFDNKIGIWRDTDIPGDVGADGDLWRKFTQAGQTAEFPATQLVPVPAPGEYRKAGHGSNAHNIGSDVRVDFWNVNEYSANSAGRWTRIGQNNVGKSFGTFFEFTFPQPSTTAVQLTISIPMSRTKKHCGNNSRWRAGIGFRLMQKGPDGALTTLADTLSDGGKTMSSGVLRITFTGLTLNGGESLAVAGLGFARDSMVWVDTSRAKMEAATAKDDFDVLIKSNGLWKHLALLAYPIGSIYMSASEISPQILFGGEWEKIEDKFLLAASSTYHPLGSTGGTVDHQHVAPVGYDSSSKYFGIINVAGTTSNYEKAGGYHTVKAASGGGTIPAGIAAYNTQKADHIPPYIAVNVWYRKA